MESVFVQFRVNLCPSSSYCLENLYCFFPTLDSTSWIAENTVCLSLKFCGACLIFFPILWVLLVLSRIIWGKFSRLNGNLEKFEENYICWRHFSMVYVSNFWPYLLKCSLFSDLTPVSKRQENERRLYMFGKSCISEKVNFCQSTEKLSFILGLKPLLRMKVTDL